MYLLNLRGVMNLNRLTRLLFRIIPNFILRRTLHKLPGFQFFRETSGTQTPISFNHWYRQKVLREVSNASWPVHFTSTVVNPENIECGIETSPGYSPGNYIQAIGKVTIGDYTQIAPNVGIISANHDIYDNSEHIVQEVKIGRYGWIGMGAIILPGVELGDFTIVAAGAIVTKSFPEGYVVIGGNPAREIKKLDPNKCVEKRSQYEYRGYTRVNRN